METIKYTKKIYIGNTCIYDKQKIEELNSAIEDLKSRIEALENSAQ